MKKLSLILFVLLLASPAWAAGPVIYGPAYSPATSAETVTGTATDKVVTPAGLTARLADHPPITIVSTTATQTLPAATVGLKRVYTTDSNAVVMTIAPPANKKIVWDRVLLTADYKLVSDGLAYATLFCEVIVADQWTCYANSGAFTATAP